MGIAVPLANSVLTGVGQPLTWLCPGPGCQRFKHVMEKTGVPEAAWSTETLTLKLTAGHLFLGRLASFTALTMCDFT